MKLLAITALFVAGALAVPANSYPPPPPPPSYGGDYGGDVGYGGDYGGDHGGDHGGDYRGDHGDDGGDYGGDYGDDRGDNGYKPPPTDDNGGTYYPPPPDSGGYPPYGGGDGGDGNGYGNGGDGEHGGADLCAALLYSNPQCCSTNVLGVLGLDCESPHETPSSVEKFVDICSSVGKDAGCCVLPVAGQGILCEVVIG